MRNAPEAPPRRFDLRPLSYAVLAILTLLLPAGVAGEGVSHETYAHDVQEAAAQLAKVQHARYQYEHKEISPAASREAQQAAWAVIGKLQKRYYAISDEQGRAFEAAYSRAAEPAMQKLRSKYQPGAYAAPSPHPHKPQEPSFWDSMSESWTVRGIIIFLVIGVLAWIDDYVKKQQQAQAPPPPQPPPLSTVHGSAKWAAPSAYPNTPASRGVTFGYTSHPTDPTAQSYLACSVPEKHVLITAQTRAGKGTRVIIPTLLSYAGSIIVIDPKGENAAVTARARRDKLGQNIYILNPWGILQDHFARLGFTTATYNPIDAIQRDDPNAVATATSLANIICPQSHGARDAFWQMSAANVMTGILLWIADNPLEQKTLARAREICTMRADDFQAMLCRMVASRAYQGAIGELLNRYIGMAKETFDGIMAHLDSHTRFLSDPQIKATTASSTLSMTWLRDYPVTIYIVMPHHLMGTYSGWLKLVMAAATESLKARIQNPTPPQYRVMFMIDEFGSMGNFANIPSDIAVMSGYGLDYTLIIQGLDQIKQHYGDAKNTILSNCAFKWFCNISDYDSAKYVSDILGKATVRTSTTSHSSGTSANEKGDTATSGSSTSYGETGRHLLTPDEIIKLGRNTAILLHPFGDPVYLKPADYWTQFHQSYYDRNPNMKMQ